MGGCPMDCRPALQAAILFAQQGAHVVVSDLDADKSQASGAEGGAAARLGGRLQQHVAHLRWGAALLSAGRAHACPAPVPCLLSAPQRR